VEFEATRTLDVTIRPRDPYCATCQSVLCNRVAFLISYHRTSHGVNSFCAFLIAAKSTRLQMDGVTLCDIVVVRKTLNSDPLLIHLGLTDRRG